MRWLIVIYMAFIPLLAAGQSASKADALFNKQEYAEASQIYQELLKKRPNDALYNYRFARCSYELKEYQTAVKHFEISGTRYPLRNYYLAESYYQLYRFEEALRYFTDYLQQSTVNEVFQVNSERRIPSATIGARLLNRVEYIEITDSIIVNKKDFLSSYELSRETGKLEQTISKNHKGQAVDLITFTTQRGDRKLFSDTTRHSVDLYMANKLLDGWSNAEPLTSAINTDANENYPFLLLDGLTLYYASDGDGSMGGYDIFMTRYSGVSNDYLNPDNVGMPFNSLANDYMLVIDEVNHAGWFASDRNLPADKVAIYRFVYTGEKKYLTNDSTSAFFESARLQTINWSEATSVSKRRKVEVKELQPRATITFQVTDKLGYTQADQFKSELAASLFENWLQLYDTVQEHQVKLDALRRAYNAAAEDSDRAALSRDMLVLEQEVPRLRRQLDDLEVKIRNEEIKFLNKTDNL